ATLPSLPKACRALDQALKDDQAPVEALVRIIESDVGMASKVLQLVNSSFFGVNRRVACISQAVNYLGLNTIRNLVLAQAMFQEFQGYDVVAFEREQVRLQVCARIVRQLFSDKGQAEAAATAALLHDVGHLVLASRMPVEHQKNLEFAREHAITLCEAEREHLGTTHAEIGAYLLGLWGLPYDVIEAVAHHHAEWDTFQSLDVTASVRLADGLACSLLCNDSQLRLQGDLAPPELLERFGIRKTFEALGEKLRQSLPSTVG
ncbi:MAG TPA: HDOD domain-containing protein, partial [Polyangiaceae bacterium]